MTNRPHVKVLMPTKDSVSTRTVECLLRLLVYGVNNGIKISFKFSAGTLLANSRSKLLEFTLQDEDVTHLMFIDSDMVFRPEWISKMIDSNKPIVAGIAKCRGMMFWNGFKYNKEKGVYVPLMDNDVKAAFGLIEVDAVGSAFVMIRKEAAIKVNKYWLSVRAKMKDLRSDEPFIDHLYHIFRNTHNLYNNIGAKSEDVYFSELAKFAGVPIFVDPEIRCGHLLDFVSDDPSPESVTKNLL